MSFLRQRDQQEKNTQGSQIANLRVLETQVIYSQERFYFIRQYSRGTDAIVNNHNNIVDSSM